MADPKTQEFNQAYYGRSINLKIHSLALGPFKGI